jgi:hypothetical protein
LTSCSSSIGWPSRSTFTKNLPGAKVTSVSSTASLLAEAISLARNATGRPVVGSIQVASVSSTLWNSVNSGELTAWVCTGITGLPPSVVAAPIVTVNSATSMPCRLMR